MRAELKVMADKVSRPEELVAQATISNDGSEAVSINVVPLTSPSLCLELVDEQGNPTPLPPPSVPRELVRLHRLEPSDRHAEEFRGFVPSWTEPGRYRARLRYVSRNPDASPDEWTGELHSDWVHFEIG